MHSKATVATTTQVEIRVKGVIIVQEKYAVLFFTAGEGYNIDIKENQTLAEIIKKEKQYVTEFGLGDKDVLHILKVNYDGSTDLIYDIRYGFIDQLNI
jgi:hypothetical protein